MKIKPVLFSIAFCVSLLAPHCTMAADSTEDMPSILRVCRADVAAKDSSAYGRQGQSASSNDPFNYIAMIPLSGPREIWYFEPHTNYASIEERKAATGSYSRDQFCPNGVKWIAS